MENHTAPLTALKKRICTRSRNWYMLDLTVTSSGFNLTLCLRNPKTGQVATDTVAVDPDELAEVYRDRRSFNDYADQIIERFVYPVRPLQLLSDE